MIFVCLTIWVETYCSLRESYTSICFLFNMTTRIVLDLFNKRNNWDIWPFKFIDSSIKINHFDIRIKWTFVLFERKHKIVVFLLITCGGRRFLMLCHWLKRCSIDKWKKERPLNQQLSAVKEINKANNNHWWTFFLLMFFTCNTNNLRYIEYNIRNIYS